MAEVEIQEERENEFKTTEPTEKELSQVSELKERTEKPRYNRMVRCTIEDVQILRREKVEHDKVNETYSSWLIALKYKDAQGVASRETLSGLKVYADRVYAGPKTAYARVKSMLEDFLSIEVPMNIQQFAAELKGKECFVKSEDYEWSGNKGYKNLPIEFVAHGDKGEK